MSKNDGKNSLKCMEIIVNHLNKVFDTVLKDKNLSDEDKREIDMSYMRIRHELEYIEEFYS